MSARVTCPACQHQFTVSAVGKQRICPNCHSPFVAGKSAEKIGAAAPAGQPALNKTLLGETDAPPIRFDCPGCRKPLELAAVEAGMKRSCPACGQRFQVPAAPGAASQPNLNKTILAADETKAQSSGIQPGHPAAAARPVPGRPTAPRAPASQSRTLLIGGGLAAVGLVFLLLIGCIVSIFVMSNKRRNAESLLALEAETKALKQKEQAELEARRRKDKEMADAREREELEAKQRQDRDEADRRWQEEQLRLAKLKAEAEDKRRRDEQDRILQDEARQRQLNALQAKLDEAKKKGETKKTKVIVGGPGFDLQTKGVLGPVQLNPYRKGSYCVFHSVPMTAGNTYVIGLFSSWDNYLFLESPTGALLTSNDDSGGGLNARIVFRCPADGVYRIVVSSYGGGVTGPYALTVQH